MVSFVLFMLGFLFGVSLILNLYDKRINNYDRLEDSLDFNKWKITILLKQIEELKKKKATDVSDPDNWMKKEEFKLYDDSITRIALKPIDIK